MLTLAELRTSDSATITISQGAEVLDLDPRTVRRACETGQLPSFKVGNRVLIPREALLALLTNEK